MLFRRLVWVLCAAFHTGALFGVPVRGLDGWDVMYGQTHLHEMKILSYGRQPPFLLPDFRPERQTNG